MINWNDISSYAEGTCESIDEVKSHFEEIATLDNETIEDKISECGIVRCENCGWFVEESECDESRYCEDCVPEH